MTLRKFKFWILWIQNESSCRWKLFLSSTSSIARRRSEEERIVRTFLSVLVTSSVDVVLQGVQGGVRATGVNFAVGDYANGVVVEQEREKTQE